MWPAQLFAVCAAAAFLAASGAATGQVPPPAENAATNAGAAGPADFRRVQSINGIMIVGSLKDFNPDGVPLKPGLTVTNNVLLGTSEFAALAGRFIGQPLNEQKMRELQREIILYYRTHDRPLVDVLYPEQDVSNGMLQVIVIEGRLKGVRLMRSDGSPYTNGWTGAPFMLGAIRLRTNEVISESRLLSDVDWLNRNPFRRIEAVYEPDQRDYGLSSVLLRVDERRPWAVDFGYENSGSRLTSEDRLIAGFTWGKAFGLTDHLFRYAFTADPSFELLRAHTASYFAPLPWRHGLRLSGYYLDVEAEPGTGLTLSGAAYQTSLRYEVPLPAFGKFQHEASIGLDFKSSENNLFFNSVSFVNTPTEIFQIAVGYSAVLPDPLGRTSAGIQGYYSPGDVTDKNTDEAFNLSRPGAEANYAYARFNLERVTVLPWNFTWIIHGGAQIADGNLLPSEQLGMGGYATARGYEEREGNGDQGYLISNELRTPPFSVLGFLSKEDPDAQTSILHPARKTAPLEEKIQLLAFWDYGQVSNVELLSGEDAHIVFSSVGVGIRYSLSRHLALRFDYGWQLMDTGLGSPDNSRGHLGVTATY